MNCAFKFSKKEFGSFAALIKSCGALNSSDFMSGDNDPLNRADRIFYRKVLFDLMMKLTKRVEELKSDGNSLTLNDSECYVVFMAFSAYPVNAIKGLELSILLQVREAIDKQYMNKETSINNTINYELQ